MPPTSQSYLFFFKSAHLHDMHMFTCGTPPLPPRLFPPLSSVAKDFRYIYRVSSLCFRACFSDPTRAQASISVDSFRSNSASKGKGGGFADCQEHRQPGIVRMRDRKPRYDCNVSECTPAPKFRKGLTSRQLVQGSRRLVCVQERYMLQGQCNSARFLTNRDNRNE